MTAACHCPRIRSNSSSVVTGSAVRTPDMLPWLVIVLFSMTPSSHFARNRSIVRKYRSNPMALGKSLGDAGRHDPWGFRRLFAIPKGTPAVRADNSPRINNLQPTAARELLLRFAIPEWARGRWRGGRRHACRHRQPVAFPCDISDLQTLSSYCPQNSPLSVTCRSVTSCSIQYSLANQ